MPTPLLCFIGDDFTGSTDALELLTLAGLKAKLFTRCPSASDIAGLDALGIATELRSLRADQIEQTLRDLLPCVAALPVGLVHYKVCSTFDSSPDIGSIGRAIDVAFDVFRPRYIPVMPAAPSLGRYCVFGNLYARYGTDGEVFRLDRHPSVSKHPVTPMTEADIVQHLSRQTSRRVSLVDFRHLAHPPALPEASAVVLDTLTESDLAHVGTILDRPADARFIVGSSGVESALLTRWTTTPVSLRRQPSNGPGLVLCGSCSPVSIAQTRHAIQHGFCEVKLTDDTLPRAVQLLQNHQNVILHTDPSTPKPDGTAVGRQLGQLARELLAQITVARVVVAGGDTSGAIARALGITSMQMVGSFVRGAPVVRASAPGSPADGVEMIFKGGQVGSEDFFPRAFEGAAV